jgi:site-specific DNA recombinase
MESAVISKQGDGVRNVGVWIRVSTDDQAKGDSPKHHQLRAEQHAKDKGWVVTEVYHLEGVSGKSVSRHPEAQRMLADVRSKRISALIFSKVARLARNTLELLQFWDVFKQSNAELVSLDDPIDTTNAFGKAIYTVMGTFAELERDQIASRVKASIPIRANQGRRQARNRRTRGGGCQTDV